MDHPTYKALRAYRPGIAPMLLRVVSLACLLGLTGLSAPRQDRGAPTAAPAVPGARQANNVAVLTIKGEITDVTARSFERRLMLAERAGADALVVEIDTPGGDLQAVLAMCNAIKGSRIKNTVAWINPSAYSGGAIVALACKRIVTSLPATMGDALVIVMDMLQRIRSMPEHERQKFMSPLIAEVVASARENGWDELLVQGIISRGVELWLVEDPETGRRMTINAAEYEMIFGEPPVRGAPRLASAPRSGEPEPAPIPTPDAPSPNRGPRRGGGQVAPGVSEPPPTRAVRPAEEGDPRRFTAASPNLAEFAEGFPEDQLPATTRPVLTSADRGKWSLVEYVSTGDGPFVFKDADLMHYGLSSAIVRTDEELKAYLGAKNLLRLDQNWSEVFVAYLTSWGVRVVLIVVFLIALFLEMTSPGLGIPGAVAALALVGLIAPPMLINLANWWEVAAILTGIALVALEIFVLPGFGFFGIVGVLALFGGLVGTFVPEGGAFPDASGGSNDLLYGVATLVLSVGTAGVGIYLLSKHFGSLPLFSKLILKDVTPGDGGDEMLAAIAPESGPIKLGQTGRALSSLRPAGRAEINGRVTDVVAGLGYVPAGTPIVVTEVTPFRVVVEAAASAPGTSGAPASGGGRSA
ncbi:MAG: hypothetical protein ACKVU4_14980 [Phycisphaerales bacterium]